MICTFVFQKIIKLGKSMKIIFLITFFSVSLIGFAQGVSWTKFEDLKDSIAKEKKPIIVKVETPWCGYCKLMEAKIYSKKRFVKRIPMQFKGFLHGICRVNYILLTQSPDVLNGILIGKM